jgi:hypothetical protein
LHRKYRWAAREPPQTALLAELDGIAVGIGNPGQAEILQEVVGRRQDGCPGRSERRECAVGVIRPQHDLDGPPVELRLEAVVGHRRLDCRDADGKAVERHLDMDRQALLRGPERLHEA